MRRCSVERLRCVGQIHRSTFDRWSTTHLSSRPQARGSPAMQPRDTPLPLSMLCRHYHRRRDPGSFSFLSYTWPSLFSGS